MKASALLQLLEKYNAFFGLKLNYLLFIAAEQVSHALQKNIVTQDALLTVEAAKEDFKRIQSDDFKLSLVSVAKEFIARNEERMKHFGII